MFGCAFRENQAPPSSAGTSVPGIGAVHVRPPRRSRASRTITERSRSRRSRAAVRPANPAPTTMTSVSMTLLLSVFAAPKEQRLACGSWARTSTM